MILSASLLFKALIKVNSSPVFPSFLNAKQIIFLKDILNTDGTFVSLEQFCINLNINCSDFKWIQLKHSIPKDWVNKLKDANTNLDICDFNIHLNKKARIISLKKLTLMNFIYFLSINCIKLQPLRVFQQRFGEINIWEKFIYFLESVQKTLTCKFFNIKFCI